MKLKQLGISRHLLEIFSSCLTDGSLKAFVNGNTSANYPVIMASFPQGSVLGPILWGIRVNDLQELEVKSGYVGDCTLSRSCDREEAADVIENTIYHHNGNTTLQRRSQIAGR